MQEAVSSSIYDFAGRQRHHLIIVALDLVTALYLCCAIARARYNVMQHQ